MYNRFKSNRIYKKYARFIMFFLFVILFVSLSIFIIYKGLDIVKQKDIYYLDNSTIDYNVYLKDNDYYETNYLEKDHKYLASLIDKIVIDYNYDLSSDDAMKGNYSYYFALSLVVKEQNKNDILWKKDYNLTEKKELNFENQNKISINDNISIDYGYYNNLAAQFKKDYGVLTDSFIYVKLIINTQIVQNSDKYEIEKAPYLIIPLGEKTVEFEEHNIVNDVSSKAITYTKYPVLNYIILVFGIIFLIIYLYLGIKVIKLFIRSIKNRNKYEEFIRKIFSNYDQIIVNVSKLPNLNGIDVMDVSSFEELVDAQLEIHKPIVFSEISTRRSAVFILIDDKQAYRYIVRAEDFKK